jgi:hypothetical protein
MKKLMVLSVCMSTFFISVNAQGLKGLIKNIKNDTSSTNPLKSILKTNTNSLTNDELIGGLKEALQTGATKSSAKLSAVDGYFANAALKIMMPAEAKKVESTLRNFGMSKQVDELILTMNRGAENAAKEIAPIFIDAVKQMSIKDGWSILKGSDTAATQYLRNSTTSALTEKFRPVIDKALSQLNAAKYWDRVFSSYNQFSREKVNTDLTAYVTEKALAGVFYQIALEEKDIRKNPAARTTDLLKKVFSN